MTIFQDRNLKFSKVTEFLKNSQTDIKLKKKIWEIQRRLLEKHFTQPPIGSDGRQGKKSYSLSHCKSFYIFLVLKEFWGTMKITDLQIIHLEEEICIKDTENILDKNHSRMLPKSKERDEYLNRFMGHGEHQTEKTTK